jgi:phenylpropionate dioxygenase-like ring-hydroxylating dioxygenase large terminal subunit
MLTAEDNDLLTRTGAGTPMGEYFRRFWQPAALSEELAEPDGAPVRVTVMGESLVGFRDTKGRIGLLDTRCPHRGADLFFGRNEDCGLRCVYHGWKFDVTGEAVDLPNVPPGARHHDTVRVKAYPAREYGGIVWAWLGPAGTMPEVPRLEYGLMPPARRYVSKQLIECNWAQVMEGDLDTSHFSFLHMPAPSVPSNENTDAPADARRLRWIRNDPMPKFQILDHDVGFVVGGARSADEEGVYWRMTQFMLPSHGTGPSTMPGETYFGFTVVPITDTASWIYVYAWNPERTIGPEERAKFRKGHGIIAEIGPDYVPLRNRSNDFEIDRTVQKTATFTGVRGLAEQDLMIQQSQGYIADRTRETLTATDAAAVKFRRTLLAAAKALAAGREPETPWRADAYCIRPGSWFAAEGTDFEDVLAERFGDSRGRVRVAE